MTATAMQDRGGHGRAWAVFIGCCLMQMCGLGTVLNSSSAFFTVVPQSIGAGMGQFALWLTAYGLFALIGTGIAGTLASKTDVKWCVVIGSIGSALCLVAFSFATNVTGFIAVGAFMGIFGGMYFLYACPVLMGAWFVKKRGLFLGIANCFSGIGGGLWPILFTSLFPTMGYGNVYILNAVIIVVCIVPFALTVFTDKPLQKGYLPYGVDSVEEAELANQSQNTDTAGVPAKRAYKAAGFWVLLVGCALFAFMGGFNSFMQNQVILTLGPGFAVFSATCMTALQLGYIIATPVSGALCDRFGALPVSIGLCIICALALLAFVFNTSQWMFLVICFVFGTNNTTVTVAAPMLVRESFGNKDYDTILAKVMMGIGLVGCFGSTILGFTYDAVGNYNLGFICGIVDAVLMMIFVIFGFKLSKKIEWDK